MGRFHGCLMGGCKGKKDNFVQSFHVWHVLLMVFKGITDRQFAEVLAAPLTTSVFLLWMVIGAGGNLDFPEIRHDLLCLSGIFIFSWGRAKAITWLL